MFYARFVAEDQRFAFSKRANGGIQITAAEHAALLEAQSAGKVIRPDESGRPVALDPAPPTPEQRIEHIKQAITAHLDKAARAKGYDNIINAALRAAYPGPYQAEGIVFATWMDATWQKAYELLAMWQAGDLPEPTADELIGMLPILEQAVDLPEPTPEEPSGTPVTAEPAGDPSEPSAEEPSETPVIVEPAGDPSEPSAEEAVPTNF